MQKIDREKLEGTNYNELQRMVKEQGISIKGRRTKKNLITAILKRAGDGQASATKKEDKPKAKKRSRWEQIFLEAARLGAMSKEGNSLEGELDKDILEADFYSYPKLRAGRWYFRTPGYFPQKTGMKQALNGKNWSARKKEVRLFDRRGNIITFSIKYEDELEEGQRDSKGNHFLLVVPREGQKVNIDSVTGDQQQITRDNYLEHWQEFSNHGRTYKAARILAYTYKLNYIHLPRGRENGYNKSNRNNRNYEFSFINDSWFRLNNKGTRVKIKHPLYDIINHIEEII